MLPVPALALVTPPFLAGPTPVSRHAVPSGGQGPMAAPPPPLLAPGRVAGRLRHLRAGAPPHWARGQRSLFPGRRVPALPRPGCWLAASGLPPALYSLHPSIGFCAVGFASRWAFFPDGLLLRVQGGGLFCALAVSVVGRD